MSVRPTGTPRIADAAAVWDAALQRIDDQERWIAEANADVTATGLVKDGVPAMRVARPVLVGEDDFADDQNVVDAVGAALVAAGDLALDEPGVGARYLAGWADDPRLADLLRIPTGYPQPIVIGRFDGVAAEDGLHILEFNGGLPGGVMPMDLTGRLMATWSPAAALAAAGWQVRIPDLAAEVRAGILRTWTAFGGSGAPRVVFAVPDEFAPYVAASLTYSVDAAVADGWDVTVADPGRLVHRPGALMLDGRRVDVVLRVFFTSMLGALGSRLDALFAAARAGDVCLVTSMRSGVYGHKALFAMVTDPDVELDVPADVRAAAVTHLPWTRVLRPGTTGLPDGSRGDLLAWAESHATSLVLKPADGFGGMGVLLGWETDPAAWSAALREHGDGRWILQERLVLESETFPVLEPGFPQHAFTADHNPVIADGSIVGYFVRLAASGGITNITSGAGSVVPTFFLSSTP